MLGMLRSHLQGAIDLLRASDPDATWQDRGRQAEEINLFMKMRRLRLTSQHPTPRFPPQPPALEPGGAGLAPKRHRVDEKGHDSRSRSLPKRWGAGEREGTHSTKTFPGR